MTNFKHQLNIWGQAQRLLPINNSSLKSFAINNFKANSVVNKPFVFPWRMLTVGVFAALALVVILPQISYYNFGQRTFTASISQNSTNLAPINKIGIQDAQDLNSDQFKTINKQITETEPSRKSEGVNLYQSPPQNPAIIAQPSNEPPISDSREFLKTYYNSQIQSRKAEEFSQTAQTTIRGFGGRIDAFSSSKMQAHISFSLPAGKLEAFKLQLKTLAGVKFYQETLSAENFLPQKQEIEKQTSGSQKQLGVLNQQKTASEQTHKKNLASLSAQLKTSSQALENLQAAVNFNPTDLALVQKLEEQKKETQRLKNAIYYENSNYQYELESLNSQIDQLTENLENLGQENSKLTDNINTVNGQITIYQISLFEYINAYFPLMWLLIILPILALLYFSLRRQKVVF